VQRPCIRQLLLPGCHIDPRSEWILLYEAQPRLLATYPQKSIALRAATSVEVFTREKLSDEIRARLAEGLSNTMMTVEIGGPTESAKSIDWMWFHTMPADSWAVGGRFDDTYVKGRKMALARIIAPQGLMNAELKSRAVKEVARVLKSALGVSRDEDDTGIFTMCVEIDAGQWANGSRILTLFQLLDDLGGNVSEQRRTEMSARYPQKR
jgi:phenylpyruvate tautomerase PptA (4-oxalocrotonate tautomerase family)